MMNPNPADSATSPPTLDYAVPATTTRPPQPPDRPLRAACIHLILAASCLVIACVASGAVFTLVPYVALFFAIIALIFGVVAMLRSRDSRLASELRITTSRFAWMFTLDLLCVFGGFVLCKTACIREQQELATLFTKQHLMMIWSAHSAYVEDFRSTPDSLALLVKARLLFPHDLWSLGEPDFMRTPEYSSFEYQRLRCPMRDEPELVICYERAPWGIVAARMFPRRCRAVLFADGRVSSLTESEFAAALLDDQRRRAELGWPIRP